MHCQVSLLGAAEQIPPVCPEWLSYFSTDKTCKRKNVMKNIVKMSVKSVFDGMFER